MPRSGGGIYSLPPGSTIANGDTSDASDLNTPLADIEADLNTVRPIVAGGTGASSAADARTNLGLVIGTNVQAYDAGLQSIAGLTTAADRMIYTTAADTYAVATLTSFARTILDDADAATVRATIGAQASDGALTSLAGLSLAAGDILVATGADTVARLPIGTASQQLRVNAGGTASEWFTPTTSGLTFATAVAASGSSVDFTSIPATARRITVSFFDLSHNAANATFSVQIGDSGGVETTGYTGTLAALAASPAFSALSTAFQATSSNDGSMTASGNMTLVKTSASANTWVAEGTFVINAAGSSIMKICGVKTLSATLDRVRVLTSSGSFDAGTISVAWE